MKPIIYFITAALVLVTGCHKSETVPSQEQYDRYIFFSQGIDTKASLINSAADMAGKEFAVIGFEYDKSSTWSAEKSNAVPNVFYNDAGTATIPVETLTCDNEGTNASTIAAEYSPLQGWSNTKKYSFFAYYPNSVSNNYVSLVNLNGTTYTPGAPSIKYTMNPAALKASMVDLMTASPHKDLDGSDSDKTSQDVTFNFSHRLSCLGLKVKNSSGGDIEISNVTFILSGIRYTDITIPLDEGTPTKTAPTDPISSTLSLDLNGDGDTMTLSSTANDGEELTDKLIFIPQPDDDISIQVKIVYKRLASGGYDEYDEFVTLTLPGADNHLTTALTEGKKHIVTVNFTNSTVNVSGAVPEPWKEKYTIKDTFN